ncbi:MAG: hypothetical protein KAH46_06930 [Mycobacterium sp.]|nr:hypothetical protein [Mycobacterium sp.]
MDPANASKRLATFIETANRMGQRRKLPAAYAISSDPAGPVSLRRFGRWPGTSVEIVRRAILACGDGHVSTVSLLAEVGTRRFSVRRSVD